MAQVHIQRTNGGLCRAAVAQMQGWRNSHEDAHFMQQEKDSWSHFGVPPRASCFFGKKESKAWRTS